MIGRFERSEATQIIPKTAVGTTPSKKTKTGTAARPRLEHRAYDDPDQDQGPDGVQTPVARDAEGYSRSGNHAAKDQRRHCRQPGRNQRVVDQIGRLRRGEHRPQRPIRPRSGQASPFDVAGGSFTGRPGAFITGYPPDVTTKLTAVSASVTPSTFGAAAAQPDVGLVPFPFGVQGPMSWPEWPSPGFSATSAWAPPLPASNWPGMCRDGQLSASRRGRGVDYRLPGRSPRHPSTLVRRCGDAAVLGRPLPRRDVPGTGGASGQPGPA